LRILDADGRSLPFEVETWNPAGTCVIWVRLDRLDADKTLQATWQSGVNIEAWPKAEVWKNNYKCAYHFDENGAAKIGLAADDFNDFADGFTVSVWADVGSCATKKLAAFSASSYSFDINYTAEEQNVISLGLTGFYLTPKSGSAGGFSADLGAAAFAEFSSIACGESQGVHHYVWISDGHWFKKYRDGELVSSMFVPMTLGSGIPGVRRMTASFANGSLAEVHVANKARSAAWIAAEYANKAGGMVTLGEVTRPGLTASVK
jgi:hypothetical protein